MMFALRMPATLTDDEQREKDEQDEVRQAARDLLEELRRDLANFRRTADEDRLGYPLVNAMQPRRPRHAER